MNIKRRLSQLEKTMTATDLVLSPITDNMSLDQAAQTYRNNLRLFNDWWRAQPPLPATEPEMSLEDATARVSDMLAKFPRSHRPMTSQS